MCFSVYSVQNLSEIEKIFGSKPHKESFENYKMLTKQDPKKYQPFIENRQIYPNYFAPVSTLINGQKTIFPMRYRVRPSWSEKDLPTKYNLFNNTSKNSPPIVSRA